MYVIKIFHGYVSKEGKRTFDMEKVRLYHKKEKAEQLANIVGGLVKKIEVEA